MPILEKDPQSLHDQVRQLRRHGREEDRWEIYGSSITEYERETFCDVLGGLWFEDFIQQNQSPTVIDLMSPTDTLASLFQNISSQTKLGLAVSLEDRRDEGQRKRDDELGIQLVTGNVMNSSTWKKIAAALNGRKADLIMERAEAGLNYIPIHKKFYAMMMRKVWPILSNDNGMLFAQTLAPRALSRYDVPVKQWVDLLKGNGIDAVYIPLISSMSKIGYLNGALQITKKPDSPEVLPLLK